MVPPNFPKLNSRQTTIILFAITLFAVAASAVTLLGAYRAREAADAQVKRTNSILSDLRAVIRVVLDAESGQRGYLLTQDDNFLEPYRINVARLPAAVSALEKRTGSATMSEQSKRLDRLKTLINRRMENLAEAIELAENGDFSAARSVFASRVGKHLMDQMRDVVAEFEYDEQVVLRAAQQRAIKAERLATIMTILMGIALLGVIGIGLWLIQRAARAEADIEQSEQIKEARDKADLLARELNHRVKNIFAIVSSLVTMTARGESDAEVMADKLKNRIAALANAHTVSQGGDIGKTASLRKLIEAVLAPYSGARGQKSVQGPEVVLPDSSVTPLGLILHELATNAAKYGAWSVENGHVSINWTIDDPNAAEPILNFEWRERPSNSPEGEAKTEGFGSKLMNVSAQQLNGSIERDWSSNNFTVTLKFSVA